MHRDFVRDRAKLMEHRNGVGEDVEVLKNEREQMESGKKGHVARYSTSDTIRSVSTASTSSSFLRKYFEKRYFILKVSSTLTRLAGVGADGPLGPVARRE